MITQKNMSTDQLLIVNQNVGSLDNLEIFNSTGKINTSVKLAEGDSGTKIYCHEPYAQDLYNKMNSYYKENGLPANKELSLNQVYNVTARTISFDDNEIYAIEELTKTAVTIPFKEYSKPLETLTSGENLEFIVMVYRATESGEYYASEKKCLSINYKQELFKHLNGDTWFDVKIIKLIKGGYLAKYKDEVECFIPGSHAAANIIHNFSELLGKTITVMVDNYDKSNDLFILSYKKYVTHSMPLMITELKFDKLYTGRLTTTPYDFGMFLEFENYFTGLIHKSEFKDYEAIRKTVKTGDTMSFYIKDVTSKGNQYRIVLTLDQSQVNTEKCEWEKLREATENKSFEYELDKNKNSIKIWVNSEGIDVSLRRKDLERNFSLYPLVKVSKVDPINKKLKFEFVDKTSE